MDWILVSREQRMEKQLQDSDAMIVRSCLKGKKERVNELVRRYSPRIFGYVKRRIPDWHAAEDIVQESFMRAFESLENCNRPEGFGAWLFEITRNCMNEWVRKRQFTGTKIKEDLEDQSQVMSSPDLDKHSSEVSLLIQAIWSLPEETRDILLYKYEDGLACKEIAHRLGKPIGTVTKNLSNAYARLRNTLTSFRKEER